MRFHYIQRLSKKSIVLASLFLLLLKLLPGNVYAGNQAGKVTVGLTVTGTAVWGYTLPVTVQMTYPANANDAVVTLQAYLTHGPDGTTNYPLLSGTAQYGLYWTGTTDVSLQVPLPMPEPKDSVTGNNDIHVVAIAYPFGPGTTSTNSSTTKALTIHDPTLPDIVGYQGPVPGGGNISFAVQSGGPFTPGENIGVEFGIENTSYVDETGSFNVNIVLSTNNKFGPNDPGQRYVLETIPSSTGLPSGQIATSGGFINVPLPDTNPFGQSVYYVGMVINPGNQVAEQVYTNDYDQGPGIDYSGTPIIINFPQAAISVSPSTTGTLNFGSVAVGGTNAEAGTQTVTITDVGTAPLSINSITASGGPFQISNVTSNTEQIFFSGTPPTSSVSGFSSSIQSNSAETWTVTLTFDPTTTGTSNGSLAISSGDPTHPTVTVPLQGIGTPLPRLSFLTSGNPNNTLTANFGGVPNDGPGGITASGTFTLSNPGSGPLIINQNGIGLTDSQGGVWSLVSITSNTQGTINLSSTSNSIAPYGAESWSVVVTFDPTANTSYLSGLQVQSNDPYTSVSTCTLTGNGLQPMSLYVSPTSLNFGAVHATGKQVAPGTLVLSNTGQIPLALAQNAITLSDTADFKITGIQSSTQGAISLSSSGSTIAPTGSETWTVSLAFAPVTTGTLSGQLTILSNDPVHGDFPVALTGTGLNQPGILVTGSYGTPNQPAMQFGPVLNDGSGNRVATQTFTIQDIGLQPLSIPANGITISGAPFSIQSIVSSTKGTISLSSSASIAANQAEIWTVAGAFDPTSNIAYSGSVGIQSNDPVNSHVNVSLSGTGCQPTITLLPLTSSTTIYIAAGQPYNITWTAAYPPGTAQISLYTDTSTNPSSKVLITGSLPFSSGSSYAWQPSTSLIGQQLYLYGTIQDGSVSNGSFSGQQVYIEASGSFNLLSPLITTSSNYAYQYVYNGKVYSGTATLQSGSNVIDVVIPLPGGGNAVHQITINEVPSLLTTQGYTYDEMGRPKTYTNGNGIVTTYYYDLAGDLVQTVATNGDTVSYTYDNLQRRTSMKDSTGTTFYEYDDLDRTTDVITSVSGSLGATDNLDVHYDFDNANRLQDIKYPASSGTGTYEQINYGYDNANRMTSASDITASQTTTYGYNYTTGLLMSSTLANGIAVQYDYNSMGQLNDIRYLTTSGSTLTEYNYTLNSLGNASSLLTTFPGGSKKQELYFYDTLDRLNEVVYGSTATATPNVDKTVYYSYDGNGNRLSQTTVIASATAQALTYTYGSQNQLQQITDQNGNLMSSYSYDQAGNRIQMTTGTGNTYYTYNENNLLTSVITPSNYILYAYNGAGQRVSKTVNGATTNYVLDPTQSAYQVIQDRDGGVVLQSHVYGLNDDHLLDNPVGSPSQIYITDRLGSLRLLTDPSGNVLFSYSFDAFGNLQ